MDPIIYGETVKAKKKVQPPRKKKWQQKWKVTLSSITNEDKNFIIVRYHVIGNPNPNVVQVSTTTATGIANQIKTINLPINKENYEWYFLIA